MTDKRNYWAIADTHFGHRNILRFKDGEGRSVRPFKSLDEMHHTMITNWNALVGDHDNVYHLGDVFFGNKGEFIEVWRQLKGRKTLIAGNHDLCHIKFFMKGFERTTKKGKVITEPFFRNYETMKQFGNLVMTHLPLNNMQLGEKYRFEEDHMLNLHGHTHQNGSPPNSEDTHLCISVEQINYTPVNIGDINRQFKQRITWDDDFRYVKNFQKG